MPIKKITKRPIDIAAKESYSWWTKSFMFIKKTEIKTWQGIFIIAFVTGALAAMVWAVSNDYSTASRASYDATVANSLTAPDNSCVVSPAGGNFATSTDVTIKCGKNVIAGDYKWVNNNTASSTAISSASGLDVWGIEDLNQAGSLADFDTSTSTAWGAIPHLPLIKTITYNAAGDKILNISGKYVSSSAASSLSTIRSTIINRVERIYSINQQIERYNELIESNARLASNYASRIVYLQGQISSLNTQLDNLRTRLINVAASANPFSLSYNFKLVPVCFFDDKCVAGPGGSDYNQKGVVTTSKSCSSKDWADYCQDNVLHEFSCGKAGTSASLTQQIYTCPNGCSDGACNATSTSEVGNLSAANGPQPEGSILLPESMDNKVASFVFYAQKEASTIRGLQLKVDPAFAESIEKAKIRYTNEDGHVNTKFALPFSFSNDGLFRTMPFSNLDIYVPKNDKITINVYLDMVNSGGTKASSAIYLDQDDYFWAVSDSGSDQLSVGTGDLSSNTFFYRGTKLTFARQNLTTSPDSGRLFRFTAVADASSYADLGQVGFHVNAVGCEVKDLYLYDADNGRKLTAIPDNLDADGNIKLAINQPPQDNINNKDIVSIGTSARTFELRGTVIGYNSPGDAISIGFKKDVTPSEISNFIEIANNNYNIWSDRSAPLHSDQTFDWTNGYLLKDMDSSQTFIIN
jgi:hypothetical protein